MELGRPHERASAANEFVASVRRERSGGKTSQDQPRGDDPWSLMLDILHVSFGFDEHYPPGE